MADIQDNSGSINNPGPQDDADQILPALQDDSQSQAQGAGQPQAGGQTSEEGGELGQTIPTSRSLVTTPEEAADSDLIEKEWVVKAKHIVETTSSDPFLQQEELSKMKADYMKKRYNKDIGSA